MDSTDPDYNDWQRVLELIYTIPWASTKVKLMLCREMFDEYSGPPGWVRSTDEKIVNWIEEARKNWEDNAV